MNKDKQIEEKAIEEMAKVIEKTEQIARDAHCGLPSPRMYAKDLYWHGYRKRSEWISVEDDTPKDKLERVLVLLEDNDITQTIGSQRVDTDRFVDGKWVRWGKWVTHWMPLPEQAKMKGGAE